MVVADSAVLDKFYKLLDGARNAVVIIAIILIIAAILLVANTIRLSAFNRRRETASCAWSAPRTSTSSCPSWSRA
jgi:cell division transport system permease protein